MHIDLEDLRFERGGAFLVKRALSLAAVGEAVTVAGRQPDLVVHLRAWCRLEGHEFRSVEEAGAVNTRIVRGPAADQRWRGAERAGCADPQGGGAVLDRPSQRWGLAARGALVEAGSPEFHFALDRKIEVWSRDAARMYAQAAAAQWNPATAVPWEAEFELPAEVEDAIVQVMTYLIENETAALVVPSRFVAQMHPHFREVMQVLAIQAADEARHIEVFTRRALLKRKELGLSTAGGQASLQTLVDEPNFAIAAFLLSVLGEGTFLNLLWFLERFAPDPVTSAVCRLAAQDEARHVAFGMSHLREHLQAFPSLAGTLMNSVRQRHESLRHTAGLNAEVFDALVLLAAGSWNCADIGKGHDAVSALAREMHGGRKRRLLKLGFSDADAEEMSALHTRNFM
jgi:TusA-related sulfurtransferase